MLASIYHGIISSLSGVSIWFLSETTNRTRFFSSSEFQAARSAFRMETELFKLKQRPLASVGSPLAFVVKLFREIFAKHYELEKVSVTSIL